MKKQDNSLFIVLSGIFYVCAIVYILYKDTLASSGIALGAVLVIFALTKDLAAALTLGAIVGLSMVAYNNKEKFSNQTYGGFAFEGFENEDEKESVVKKAPPPDNDTRAEFIGLSKKYKAPSEEDDKDFHLDAGTTFLNAYKSLKPDQIAAMTKDTQDLMQTQKQLMSTLHTLKPLIKDGKEMMNMFQSYFGAGEPTTS